MNPVFAIVSTVLLLLAFNERDTQYVEQSKQKDTLLYVLQHDSLWDGECVDSGDGCTYIDVVYPKFGVQHLPVVDSINRLIFEWHASRSASGTDTPTLQAAMKDFILTYREYSQDAEYTEYPWYSESTVTLTANTSEIICLEIAGYSYTGGAHGNAMVTYSLLENPTGFTLPWSSLFVPGAKDSIRFIAENIFRENAQIEFGDTYEQAGFWFEDGKFHLSENIGISADGLIVYYNNYEIAPYVYGPTELTVPWKSIAKYIPNDGVLQTFIK